MNNIRDLVGEEAFAQVRALVRAAHPDPRCVHGDGLVGRVLCALPEEARAAIGAGGLAASVIAEVLDGAQETIARAVDGAGLGARYMLAHATHTRTGLGAHSFTAHLPMVTLPLPQEGQRNVATDFGIVYSGDHKLPSVDAFARKYAEFLSFTPEHVVMTTPARYLGARFGAIATYELFHKDQRRAWVLESGMATGESMMLFCSPDGETITRRTSYQPTPFSAAEDWYRGTAVFGSQGPVQLDVLVATDAEREQKHYHVHVTVDYEAVSAESAAVRRVMPAKITAEAGLRVAAIAVARGSSDPLFNLLAPFGNALTWARKP